ncbi:PREDICTED: ubiquitin carboxyl-terminal hydrolase isozyme L3 [Ceratosolen solmsi marchali]|uniref:Ubiquitin carboxyl-terminal hydrolase n=1 Tax=Ceratosolen solmsi marchali TaxID=326594 RepID=A0AAJ6VMX4_9HYME|nr:PREDICTED: ubiquitin carboxyl-terminal hydrolase isozyme L3 [Ceratosolen solmsi marchali]XP_011495338.1 PREDICTED: ubiquitin carboxyl-terminal hydrolase isozyme L3 [Ceratosolen solmsi marchali]
MAWVPLESNPEVMTKFLHKFGVPKKWELVDVYGLDPELLAMLPKPVVSLILLYPISPKTEVFKTELENKEKEAGANTDNVYHLVQYVSNACGTIALLHCVANNLDVIELADGDLKKFLDETKDLTSEKRGEKLVEAQGISSTHQDFAQEGQTEVPREDEKIIHHFVAFVEKDGLIYELDGRKPYPINHGPSSSETFLEDAARVCQEYMNHDPEEVRFTMIALVSNE